MLAVESFISAKRCHDGGLYRSVVSRAYYAMYQAATALCLHAGLVPRSERGNWSHETTAENLENASVKKLLSGGSTPLRRDPTRTYAARCDADYSPRARVDAKTGRDALRHAGTLLRVVKEVTGNHGRTD